MNPKGEPYKLLGAQNLIEKHRPILYLEAQKFEEFKRIDRILFKMRYVHWVLFGSETRTIWNLVYQFEKVH